MKTYIIGAGGVGSWVAPALCLLIGKDNVVIVDGDELEKKNLNRQLFDASQVGQNKAAALADKYGCDFIAKWYSFGLMQHEPSDRLLVCVDNHPARLAALMACDYEGCSGIFAANERTSAEAYCYQPTWRGTNLDPRVTDPSMLTDRTGDPQAAAIGCTGEAQEREPQLVTANLMAASLALHLYVVWYLEARKLSPEAMPHLPHKLVQNLTRSESFKSIIQPTEERTNNE